MAVMDHAACARQHARELLSTGYSHNQVQAAISQMIAELDRERRYTDVALDDYLHGRAPRPREEVMPQTQGGGAAPPTVTTKDQYDKLAPNTEFIGSDGKRYRKP